MRIKLERKEGQEIMQMIHPSGQVDLERFREVIPDLQLNELPYLEGNEIIIPITKNYVCVIEDLIMALVVHKESIEDPATALSSGLKDAENALIQKVLRIIDYEINEPVRQLLAEQNIRLSDYIN